MTGLIEPKSSARVVLADLLPALRWGDPHRLRPLLDDARLPGNWWNDTPLADVIATISGEEVARRAGQALHAGWPHLALGQALPNLCFCLEGQEADLRVTVGEAASAAPALGVNEPLLRMVLPLLRPFLAGGRNLMDPAPATSSGESASTPDLDVAALTSMLGRLIPADAPPSIHAAVDSLRTWVESRGHDGGSDAALTTEGSDKATATGETSWAGEPALLDEPFDVLGTLVSNWDERQHSVAVGRIFRQSPISLEMVGEQFGVSRERVRQIQVDLEKKLQVWLRSDQGQPLRGHLLATQEHLGSVATEAELRALHPAHELTAPALGLPFWQVIATLLPDRIWTRGWLVEGDLAERLEETRALLTQRCNQSAPDWTEVVALLAQQGIREVAAEEWLQTVKGFRVIDGHLLRWGRSIGDRAEAILELVERPLSMEELQERLDDTTALASLRNQIQADDRFIRRDRDLYGLRRWGGVEYLGIREMILRALESAGGEAKVEEIVSSLSSQFDVSEKSVQTYLAGPEFDRFDRGWVRVAAAAAAEYQPRRDVAQTRRCFRTGVGTWWYRLDVSGEHLRGSGFTVPAGFAAHLGLSPGGRLELSHDVGVIQLAWRNQPVCGSLRVLLEHMEAAEGDHVFLAAKDGHLKALRVAEDDEPNLTDTARALRLMALSGQISEAEMPAALGQRIGLDDATTMDEVLAHLRTRGDKDILELLSRQYDPAVTVAPSEDTDSATIPTQELGDAVTPPEDVPSDAQTADETATAPHEPTQPEHRDPAWDREVIPLLNPDGEADLIRLAEAVAARGKTVPTFGYELGESGWQADFAWDQDTAKVAVVNSFDGGGSPKPEAERRDAAYRQAGWTIHSADYWLAHLAELLALLPEANVGS